MTEIQHSTEWATRQSITRKLNNLYQGTVYLPQNSIPFITLSGYELLEKQITFLSLGPKFNFKKKFDPLTKKVETEMLYESIKKLAEGDIVVVNENLQPQLLAKPTKIRDYSYSHILTRKLKDAATNSKEHESRVVRNADKANCFVVISLDEYKHKID